LNIISVESLAAAAAQYGFFVCLQNCRGFIFIYLAHEKHLLLLSTASGLLLFVVVFDFQKISDEATKGDAQKLINTEFAELSQKAFSHPHWSDLLLLAISLCAIKHLSLSVTVSS